jgi:hypothetical protein
MSGDLPGYAANAYPVIKSGGTIHFANNGKYSAYIEGNDTYFGILDSAITTKVLLHTSGNSYFNGGNVGIGTTSPDSKLHVAGNIRATGQSLFLSTSSVFNKITLNGTDMEIWSGALFPSIDITNTGLLKFGAYALSGTGIPTKLLGVDNSGNVLTTVSGGDLPGGPYLPLSGGTMTGTGNVIMANGFTLRAGNSNNNAPAYTFRDDTNTGMFQDIDDALSFSTGGATVLHLHQSDAYIPQYIKHFSNGNTKFGFPADNTITFITSGTERIRIDSSGQVGINEPSPTATLHLKALGTNGTPFKLVGDSATTAVQQLITTAQTYTSGASWYNMVCESKNGGGTTVSTFIIERDGDVRNLNNSYGQISDIRLKENILDATPKLEDIKKLKVKNFNFIGDDLKQIGLIAQEVEEIFPGLVKEDMQPGPDGTKGGVYKSVKYSIFVPMMIKAMQEQQEIIENLTTRIEQLEN